MRALPPSTTGQPSACASVVNSSPNAPDRGAVKGSMEWAAAPATMARASSVWNRLASRCAEESPFSPKMAVAIGSVGIDRSGARKFGKIRSASRTSEENVRT